MKLVNQLAAFLLLTSTFLTAQITYVDSNSANTTAVGGTPNPYSTTATTADNLWKFRPDFGFDAAGNNGIYEKDGITNGFGDAAMLVTKITGLTANQEYAIYVNFLSDTSNQWQVKAGLSTSTLSTFTPTSSGVENLGLTSVTGSNRNQLRGFISNATANANGEIEVFIDDGDATSTNGRTWYDGVSFGASIVTPVDPSPGKVVTDDGVWTWFNDERAIWHSGKLYVGHVKRNGKIAVTQYDPVTDTSSETELSTLSQTDDHNNPSLHVRPDGKILAAYSRHNPDNHFFYRISNNTSPATITDWGPESQHGTTKHSYSNTYAMSAESDKIYTFTRATGWNPNWATSDDNGDTWSDLEELVHNGGTGTRPYVRYSGNGVDAIDFIYTDGHPRDENNSLYHARIKGGNVLFTDGTVIKSLANTPLLHDAATPERGSVVYQYSNAAQADPNQWIPAGRAWTWDVQQQENDDPVITFTVQKDDVTGSGWSNDRIYYYYARWTGTAWQKRFIAHAGRPLYNHEDDYAGGICIDPENTNVVYISSNAANPFDLSSTTNVPLNANNRYEIYKGTTADGGLTFTWEAVTEDSDEDNIRPFVPQNHGKKESLLWLNGTYNSYTNYHTKVRALIVENATGFQLWQENNSIAGGPSDDDDGDGETNIEEYYRSLVGLAEGTPLLTMDQTTAVLNPVPDSPDLNIFLQHSDDLVSWDSIVSSITGNNYQLLTMDFTLQDNASSTLVIPSPPLIKSFLRLKLALDVQ